MREGDKDLSVAGLVDPLYSKIERTAGGATARKVKSRQPGGMG